VLRIRDVNTGSRNRIFSIPEPPNFSIRDPIPDPGVKKAPDPGSWIRIRKIACLVYEENDGPVRPVSVDENREGGGAENSQDCLITNAKPVLRIRDVNPRSEFFHPGARVKNIPDPGSQIWTRIKEFKYLFLTQKNYF
jgi:hypothetical protein